MSIQQVAIAGSSGRMGRTLLELLFQAPEFKLHAALERPDSPFLERDAGELVGAPCGIRITERVADALSGADVLIDFTRPEGTMAHLALCTRLGVKAVIGTTGLDSEQKARIRDAARDIAIVFAPNMSVGVTLLLKLLETAARVLAEGYDVEIIEAHHRHKVDAPSGTALRLGEIVAKALGRDLARSAAHGRQGNTGARDAGTIGFHAVRGGDIVGEHTVMFAGEGERVELVVRSTSRSTYAIGALRACRYLKGRPPGL